VKSFIQHRLEREQQIIDCVKKGLNTIPRMVPVIYSETDPQLHGAAARSVLAAMERLVSTDQICCEGKPSIESVYQLTNA